MGVQINGRLEVWGNYAPITNDSKVASKHHCNQSLFGIPPHVSLIHYLDNSVSASTFLQISSKKVVKIIIGGGPYKIGRLENFSKKIKPGESLFGT